MVAGGPAGFFVRVFGTGLSVQIGAAESRAGLP
jgi:hypothetical protein